MQIELQRQAQEVLFNIAADLFDQAQGLAVAAEQQVLAVVKDQTIPLKGAIALSPAGGKLERGGVAFVNTRNLIWKDNPARAPAELSGALEYGNGNAALGQGDRSGHTGITAADYPDFQFLSHVLKASHSLRNGVSEMRSFSTWQPLATTSSSVVR